MALFVDARIPVLFDADPAPDDAVLSLTDAVAHPLDCACCVARHPHATELDRLFLQRVRGEVPWFRRVVICGADAELRAAIATDAVLSARYRVG